MSINFNIRMDESLKERAFPIIESYGLTPAQAVKLFLNQIADTQALPLSLAYKAGKIPNAVTTRFTDRYPPDVLNILTLRALEYLHQHQAYVKSSQCEEEDGDLFITYTISNMEHDAFWDLDLGMNQHLNQIAIEQGLDNRNIVFGLEQA